MSDTPTKAIERPWVIAHDVEGGKLEVILAGPGGDTDHRHFAIVIADIVGHVANHFVVPKAEVMKWIQKEIDNPTSALKRKLDA